MLSIQNFITRDTGKEKHDPEHKQKKKKRKSIY